MRRLAFALIAGAASAACPAFAQQQPGGPPPGGGAPPTEVRVDNRGMGSIDDIPQQSRDPRTAAENALARRGDVSRPGAQRKYRQIMGPCSGY